MAAVPGEVLDNLNDLAQAGAAIRVYFQAEGKTAIVAAINQDAAAVIDNSIDAICAEYEINRQGLKQQMQARPSYQSGGIEC